MANSISAFASNPLSFPRHLISTTGRIVQGKVDLENGTG
jgi:hypothetical protein